LATEFGELMTERFCFGKVDVANRQVIALRQLRRQFARQLFAYALPLSLSGFELGHPKTAHQRHLNLVFAWTPFEFRGGLPIMNFPGGHQHSLMPATSRSSPAFEPSNPEGTAATVDLSTGATVPPR